MTVRDFCLSGSPMLARRMHDLASHRRDDPTWLDEAWLRARVLVLSPSLTAEILIDEQGGRLGFRSRSEADMLSVNGVGGLRLFLGEEDGTPYFAVVVDGVFRRDHWRSLREAGQLLDDVEAGLLTSAVALASWHASHRFCPRCGNSTQVTRGGWSRECQRDGPLWPRIDPAVIVLVHDQQGHCVLGRRPTWPRDRYSTLAGFVEPGETPEDAVVREVREEVGLDVTDVRYLGSQPWPFPSSLMLSFVARAPHKQLVIDRRELDDARWFSREDIHAGRMALPPQVSIAHRMIIDWACTAETQ